MISMNKEFTSSDIDIIVTKCHEETSRTLEQTLTPNGFCFGLATRIGTLPDGDGSPTPPESAYNEEDNPTTVNTNSMSYHPAPTEEEVRNEIQTIINNTISSVSSQSGGLFGGFNLGLNSMITVPYKTTVDFNEESYTSCLEKLRPEIEWFETFLNALETAFIAQNVEWMVSIIAYRNIITGIDNAKISNESYKHTLYKDCPEGYSSSPTPVDINIDYDSSILEVGLKCSDIENAMYTIQSSVKSLGENIDVYYNEASNMIIVQSPYEYKFDDIYDKGDAYIGAGSGKFYNSVKYICGALQNKGIDYSLYCVGSGFRWMLINGGLYPNPFDRLFPNEE